MEFLDKPMVLGLFVAVVLGTMIGWLLRRLGESAWKKALYSHTEELVAAALRERDRARDGRAGPAQRSGEKPTMSAGRAAPATAGRSTRDHRESRPADRESDEQHPVEVVDQQGQVKIIETRPIEREEPEKTPRAQNRPALAEVCEFPKPPAPEVADLRKKVGRLESQIVDRDAELSRRGRRVASLQATLEVRSADLETAAGELQAARSRHHEAEKNLEAQRARLETLERAATEFRDIEARSRQRASASSAECAEARQALARAQQQIGLLERRIEEQQSERDTTIDALGADLSAALEAQRQGLSRIATLERTIEDLEGLYDRKHASLERVSEQSHDSSSRLAETEKRLEGSERNATRLEAALAEANESQATLQEQRTHLDRRLGELETALRDRDQALQALAPSWLIGVRRNKKDDLQAIRGLGEVLENRLNELGVYYYRQLARADRRDINWLAAKLKIPARRMLQEGWIAQAKLLESRKEKG